MADRILVFIPAYRCAPQLPRVVAQLAGPVTELVEEVVVVDNQSPDETVEVALEALGKLEGLRWTVLRNDNNYGLGGSHKVAIAYGLEHGFTHLLVLHGDDQASVDDIVPRLRAGAHHGLDALLGARFMRGATLQGYSTVRTLGNHVYNVLFSLAGRRRLHDLGSGLNLFRLEAFADGAHRRFADDLTFNYHLCFHMVSHGWRIRFFPITWREEDQRSNVKLAEQGWRTLKLVGSFVRDREAFAQADFSRPGAAYTASVVARS
jgi:glycosyltransferase involved in cell wall biosynthesis